MPGARPVAIVYDVALTLDLPAAVTAGTSLNGLAHCAEALYVQGHGAEGDEEALRGARLISDGAAARAGGTARSRSRARSCSAEPRTPVMLSR